MPLRELWADNAIGTVNTIANAGATTLHVTTVYGSFPVPASGVSQFHAVINPGANFAPNPTTEVVTVTVNSSGTWTVSTLAFNHAVGEVVALVVTAAALTNITNAPGAIIASLRNASATTYTITATTITRVDATNLLMTYIVPPSGSVEIEWEMSTSGLGAVTLFGAALGCLSGTSGTTHLGVDYEVATSTSLKNSDLGGLRLRWCDIITGQTPGTTVIACLAAYVLGATDAWSIFSGTGNGIANPGPIIGKVTAL